MYHPHQHPQHPQHPQQRAWPGHPYHPAAKAGGPHAPHPHVHARAPPPPPIHYPPSHHRAYYPAGPGHRSPAAPATAPRPMTTARTPVLVSPSNPTATSPASPHAVPSSPAAAATPPASVKAAAAAVPGNVVTAKPPRPYTEYTMFYQLEREYILHRVLTTDEERARNPDLHVAPQTALFQDDPLMPARYRSLPLRADWYISGKSKKPTKRKHRKSHGKIGFLELTRMIAARWAKVDDETRKYCRMMAAMELVKYKEDMESYNSYKERLARMGEMPEDMKERLTKKRKAAEKKNGKKSKDAGANALPALPPVVKADAVGSSTAAKPAVKLEPIEHASPQEPATSLDTDMEQFITSLVRSPPKPKSTKVITPERTAKRRRLFRDAPASVPGETTAPLGAPLKDGSDPLDGIKMTFSGIDENEIAREFDVASPGAPRGKGAPPAQSFDYWDALVEGTEL